MKAKKVVAKKTSVKKAVAPKKAPVVKVTKAEKKLVKVMKSKVKKVIAAVDLSDEAKEKQKVIEKYAQKSGDTGSPEVQVALLSYKIGRLSEHLNQNKKDNHSRRGLLKVVAKRRRILNYLQKLNEDRYKVLIGSLSLKK